MRDVRALFRRPSAAQAATGPSEGGGGPVSPADGVEPVPAPGTRDVAPSHPRGGRHGGRLPRVPFRRAASSPPPAEAGVTIVGDSVLPEAIEGGGLAPALPHTEVVDVEGVAPTAAPGALLETVTAWLFQPDQEPVAVDPRDLPALVAVEENFVWVDLSAYAQADLREVSRLLVLHRKAVHAALSPWQRPRLAVYSDHFATSATVARLDAVAYRVQASELDLFVGRNYLVSAHKQPLPFADHLLARARHSPELVRLDAAFMLYVVLDELLAYYEELNEHVQSEIERMEERALRDTSDRFLEDLLHFKRYAFALSQLADQHRAVFAAFLRPDFTWVSGEEVEDYFEDLEGRLARLLDTLTTAKEAVNGAFDIYVSHMSHRTNAVIKLLTIVSTVLFSASIIIGIFGTTIAATLPSKALASPAGLVVMLLCIAAVSGGTIVIFRRRGWI